MSAKVGEIAPDFKVAGTDGTDEGRRDYTLGEFRGQPVVLVFYPGDNTPVCTKQLNAYTSEIDEFSDVGAQVLAVSPQDVVSHDGFADKQGGFAFPLLADTDKAVGESYGILGPLGFYRRSVFVVDGGGIIRYAHRAVAGLTFKPTAELVAAVRSAS
jgi:peroxiredoxin